MGGFYEKREHREENKGRAGVALTPYPENEKGRIIKCMLKIYSKQAPR